MTPAEILSHLSPQERTDALAKFLQIENFDYSGMTREDNDIVQLGHYTDLHDELVATARASVEMDRERATDRHRADLHEPEVAPWRAAGIDHLVLDR